jgi:succinate dehydrogenase hydrophobic anchor subunit
MRVILSAIILMFSVIHIIAFLVSIRDITPETYLFSRESTNAIVFGWLGLYLLRLYWLYS